MKKLYLLFIPVFLFILSGFCTAQINYINNEPSVPGKYILYQNYPNPFNPTTKIVYTVPKESKVKLEIYDVLGRSVQTLVNQVQKAGNYSVEFNATKLTSGIYFYRLVTPTQMISKKMMLIK